MGVLKKLIFRMKKAVAYLTLSTTSVSATWSPQTVTNTGATLTWDVSGDIAPTSQNVDDPTFDLSANTGTVNMNVYDVGGLTQLYIYSLNISNLNITEATALTSLYCYSNSLTALNVSTNTTLIALYCNSNSLTALDVSTNTALTRLYCYSNSLTTLNVSTNTALTDLQCQLNSFSDTVTNSILASLVAHNKSNGTLHYRNNETGQGITDRETLVTRGWTIINYTT